MSEDNRYKPGTVTLEKIYVFVCGVCESEENEPNTSKRDAEYFMRNVFGWSKTVEHGWICKGCRDETATAPLASPATAARGAAT